jgi:OOP family OmpA-OmpF porin
MLKANPALIVEIQGHSDSTGPAKFNKFLSELRAKAIKAVLVKNGIESSRLTTKGFGESAPIATNDTAAGREINRRVELKASYK